MQNHLKERRMEKYLSQTELAVLSGISRSHLNRIEKGHVTPTLELSFRLASALNCSIEDIFTP